MGWEALGQWGEGVARIAPLAGGVANDVWGVRVDVPDLDLVLPDNAAGLDDDAYDIAAQASAAWEAAVCWDDEYAVKRLAEVRAV
ncbi:hypothetical protein [Plantactinospora endophytica]|uniref:Uncharacterized protein n=1 Tax=Plantactinospora endophytica TaxID=673535 RepID=A0ABQ4DYR5_9ACTN|nr:hypothetical protein [Plantactinospora endophytica]GIG87576.1 hypothetical protein Pen02_25120 [Plantactinospora endophytica]